MYFRLLIIFFSLGCAGKTEVRHSHGKIIRGKTLHELELNVEPYGMRWWTYPISSELSAGSPYGYRKDPHSGKRRNHKGQDIPCKKGTHIFAVASGKVIRSKNSRSAGKYIEIEHDIGKHKIVSRYLHLSVRSVMKGAYVYRGELIGSCGNTGKSTGPHLHFEIKIDGKAVPPFVFVEKKKDRGLVRNY